MFDYAFLTMSSLSVSFNNSKLAYVQINLHSKPDSKLIGLLVRSRKDIYFQSKANLNSKVQPHEGNERRNKTNAQLVGGLPGKQRLIRLVGQIR